jgi:hypothetical protein
MAEDDRISQLADLLHVAAEAHHVAYKATDGVDPDWSIWYADYLLGHGIADQLEAPQLVKSDLIYLLVRADKEQVTEAPGGNWERYYADFLLIRYVKE